MTKTSNNCIKILIVLSTTDIIIRKLTFFLVLVEITFSINYNNHDNINSQFECINIYI